MAPSPFFESLNGNWNLSEPADEDEALPGSFPYRVAVPGLVDLATGYDYRASRFHHYACELGGDPSRGLPHADLVLEQSMWTSAVWCNRRFSAMTNDCFLPQRFPLGPALQKGESNQVIVRIGQLDTLPTRHIAGNDYERLEWIPGIWGDAWLHRYGDYEITGVLIVPDEDLGGCLARIRVRRASKGKAPCIVRAAIRDGQGAVVAQAEARTIPLDGNAEAETPLRFRWSPVAIWHPGHPNLYDLHAEVFTEDSTEEPCDVADRRFGIRRFAVRGRDLLLNGERIRLRGGNIAFHRLLGDPLRGALPWDRTFARRALAEIPKQANMNCLRVHIGSMYSQWYDEADAAGMLLLEEWPFWNVTAPLAEVHAAFAKWIWSMNHHPSIVMWDPGNECDLGPVIETVVPVMKQLDPSRAWMHADMDEEHPYHWALIPLHPRRAMGFTRSHEEIRDSARPASVNEFGWFWTDGAGEVTTLTETVRQRWLPDGLTAADHLAYQAWLVRECTEVWRRYDVASIHPFIYLSTSRGLTGNWFEGPLDELRPKPVVAAFAEAIAPLGVSLEIASRHYLPGQEIRAHLFLFNDLQKQADLRARYGLADACRKWIGEPQELHMNLQPVSTRIVDITLRAPAETGSWRLLARVEGDSTVNSVSEKTIEVIPAPQPDKLFATQRFLVMDDDGEVALLLNAHGAARAMTIEEATTIVLCGSACRSSEATQLVAGAEQWLRVGGRLIVLEPDRGLRAPHTLSIGGGVRLVTTPEFDKDAGGYDTVVIPTSQAPSSLLKSMPSRDLGYFNGGIGNIVADESDVTLGEAMERWLVCGLARKRTAVGALRVGKGIAIVSRLQFHGRLSAQGIADMIGDERHPRFADPLAQQLLLNLLSL